jgi:hypothetical protein
VPVAIQTTLARPGRAAERAEYLLDVMIEESFVLHRRGLGFPILLPPTTTRARLNLPTQVRLLPPRVAEMLFGSWTSLSTETEAAASKRDGADQRDARFPRALQAWADTPRCSSWRRTGALTLWTPPVGLANRGAAVAPQRTGRRRFVANSIVRPSTVQRAKRSSGAALVGS